MIKIVLEKNYKSLPEIEKSTEKSEKE